MVHPVNPPSLIPLVELCGTGKTSPATIEQVRTLMRGVGMSPIVLKKEIDGFILNRLQFTLRRRGFRPPCRRRLLRHRGHRRGIKRWARSQMGVYRPVRMSPISMPPDAASRVLSTASGR